MKSRPAGGRIVLDIELNKIKDVLFNFGRGGCRVCTGLILRFKIGEYAKSRSIPLTLLTAPTGPDRKAEHAEANTQRRGSATPGAERPPKPREAQRARQGPRRGGSGGGEAAQGRPQGARRGAAGGTRRRAGRPTGSPPSSKPPQPPTTPRGRTKPPKGDQRKPAEARRTDPQGSAGRGRTGPSRAAPAGRSEAAGGQPRPPQRAADPAASPGAYVPGRRPQRRRAGDRTAGPHTAYVPRTACGPPQGTGGQGPPDRKGAGAGPARQSISAA